MMSTYRSVILACTMALTASPLAAGETGRKKPSQWPIGKTYKLKGVTVHLSAPVLVARKRMALDRDQVTDRDLSGSYLWYPQIAKLSHGELLAIIRLAADNIEVDVLAPIGFCWSSDGGLTWSDVKQCNKGGGGVNVLDHNGDLLHLPFALHNGANGLGGPLNVIPKGKREVQFIANGVEVAGWPGQPAYHSLLPDGERKAAARLNLAGFFFDGQAAVSRDGKTFLATLYGTYQGDKRFRIVCAESQDGRKWRIRSSVVDSSYSLNEHSWSNSESTICRLADGRLMCVFRVEGLTYAQCFSDDDGNKWSQPVSMSLPGYVEPSLAVMADGSVVLSGGRPELYLWFNNDGKGKDWQAINTFNHHNQLVRDEERFDRSKRLGGTSSYTEVIAVDASNLLYIYDCFTKDNHFGIYVQRATVEKTR